jgi:carbonic anhydrase/acetyltransferase-like protein (isoleucine patch superfamily)
MVLRAALAALAVAVLAACGDGDDAPTVAAQTPSTTAQAGAATTAGTVLSVTVRGGSVVDGAARQRATVNQPVTIRVTSDVADEVHVHGYEKRFDVAPGRTGEVTFVANIPGIFEVELERSHKLLFSLEVR